MKNSVSQVLAIVLLLFLILGSILFVFPMRERVAELRVEQETLNAEVATLEQEYEALAALSEEVSTSETTKQTLMAAVPDGMAQDALILELSEIATDLNFTLNAVNFSDSLDEDFGNTLDVTANFTGTYDQLIAFLRKLETSSRLMRVTSLNVQRTSTTAIAFNVHIEAYYQ